MRLPIIPEAPNRTTFITYPRFQDAPAACRGATSSFATPPKTPDALLFVIPDGLPRGRGQFGGGSELGGIAPESLDGGDGRRPVRRRLRARRIRRLPLQPSLQLHRRGQRR